MDKKSIVNDLYEAAVISVLAVGYSVLGKKILCIASEMTREYLIKQKILIDHINV